MLNTLNIFLLLFGALQGLLLSLVLFRNRRRSPSGLYLTLFLTLAGLQLTTKVMTKTWLSSHVTSLYVVSYFLPFLAGPLIYLFVRSRTTEKPAGTRDLLHLLPFLLGAIYALLVAKYGYLYTTPIDRSILMAYPKGIVQLFSLAFYSWLSIRMISGYANHVAGHALRQFVWVAAASEALIIAAIAVLQSYYGIMPDIRLLFTALTFMIYWMSYKIISQPEVFLPAGAVLIPLRVDNQSKYSHSGLKPEEADRIASLLCGAMTQQLLYLKADLSIDSLAADLKISRHYLSQVLNEKFQQTYFDFINGYRLEEASGRLTSPKFKHYTIAAIAHDSGFSSVSNFNEVFKRRFGVTPSRFRDKHADKMSA